jgi:hypothetical protein
MKAPEPDMKFTCLPNAVTIKRSIVVRPLNHAAMSMHAITSVATPIFRRQP